MSPTVGTAAKAAAQREAAPVGKARKGDGDQIDLVGKLGHLLGRDRIGDVDADPLAEAADKEPGCQFSPGQDHGRMTGHFRSRDPQERIGPEPVAIKQRHDAAPAQKPS